MAHSLSAKKRARQNIKKKLHNQKIKSQIKTNIKKIRLMLTPLDKTSDKNTNKNDLSGEIIRSYRLIDKAVSKGVIHKNKAARLKSRLTLAANKILLKTAK